MSMISAQINELREWADQLSEHEDDLGVVVRAIVASMNEAADTIWELRCKLSDMVDERERARVAEAENAKLRELVRDLWNGMYCPTEPTEGCPSCAFNVDDECAFETRIRKLGIKWVEV